MILHIQCHPISQSRNISRFSAPSGAGARTTCSAQLLVTHFFWHKVKRRQATLTRLSVGRHKDATRLGLIGPEHSLDAKFVVSLIGKPFRSVNLLLAHWKPAAKQDSS